MSQPLNLVGYTLGQYELRELLNSGRIVRTYIGYQPILERDVIVQTLVPAYLHDQSLRQGILNGARIVAGLEHPNIVPILDYGVDETRDLPYIVMRHLHGPTLWARLQDGPLSPRDTVAAVKQIGSALEYVHSHGRVHGDPGVVNIVFDTWGSAYIADFLLYGIYQARDDKTGIYGLPSYMAPERWHEQPASPASDQYALGVLAYEMLTAQKPFDADELIAIMYKHINEDAPRIEQAGVPDGVNAVLARALSKVPEDRYPTVTNFTHELEQAIETEPAHLFISYSRRDTGYAQRLKHDLRDNGLPVWIDEQIEHGAQWFNQINAAIETCAAFVVVMSPDAEQSEWVQKEILLAKRYDKPVFPVLLAGQEFPILIDIQFADVRDASLPGTDFYRRLNRVVLGGV